MDPISLTASFASIVGLICNFRSEVQGRNQMDLQAFSEWLAQHNHGEIKSLIESNHQTCIGIKAILQQSNSEFFEKLSSIEHAMATIASTLDGFDDVASATSSVYKLSDQSKSILTQLISSGAASFFTDYNFDSEVDIYLNGKGNITINEPQFIKDDLAQLVELKLLRHDFTDQGNDLYYVTRPASNLVSNWRK